MAETCYKQINANNETSERYNVHGILIDHIMYKRITTGLTSERNNVHGILIDNIMYKRITTGLTGL